MKMIITQCNIITCYSPFIVFTKNFDEIKTENFSKSHLSILLDRNQSKNFFFCGKITSRLNCHLKYNRYTKNT